MLLTIALSCLLQAQDDKIKALEAQFQPDTLASLLTARFVGPDGKPAAGDGAPVKTSSEGRTDLVWTVEISFDRDAFGEFAARLDKAFSAVASRKGGPVTRLSPGLPEYTAVATGHPAWRRHNWQGAAAVARSATKAHAYVLLSASLGAKSSVEQFRWYLLEGEPLMDALSRISFPATGQDVIVKVDALDDRGEVVSSAAANPWEAGLFLERGREREWSFLPFFVTPDIGPPALKANAFISPRFGSSLPPNKLITPWYHGYRPYASNGHCDVIVKRVKMTLANEDLERVKSARVAIERGKPLE